MPARIAPLVADLAERPGIAVITGPAAGLALEAALAADLIVAAPSARMRGAVGPPRLPGTPWRLAERLGAGGALAFWLEPRGFGAARAARRGLVDRLSDDPVATAGAIAERWRAAGPGLAALRRLLRRGRRLPERAALALERAEFALLFADDRPKAAARAFLKGHGAD